METAPHRLTAFLQDTLHLSTDSIILAWKQAEQTPSLLPITLWQYGLISLSQLDQIFDWLYNDHPEVGRKLY
ncbi:MAG: DUF2949 domain-containing protein [Plectolyngbya sp. WJT66-NPBG17]|jgi:hypothetical protein|nr:DUF2949 domain-containing protein [Plectolyngbya sp. WJT66-NPBG17]